MNQHGHQILGMIDSDYAHEPPGLVNDLYYCCLQIALGIVKSPGPTLTSSSSQRLRTQVPKLSLWGNDFDQGYLHGADRLSNALLSIFEDLAGTLTALAQHFPSEDKLSEILALTHKYKTLASEAVSRPKPRGHDDGLGDFTVDELSSSGSEGPSNDEVDQLEDLIKDVQFHNECLYGLGPVLHNSAEKVGHSKITSSSVVEQKSVSGSDQSYGVVSPAKGIRTSKWASEKKVGQEELYEAAEEVLDRLRDMEEYSDLLTQGKEMEVPDHSNIIKRPMDLETMAIKLNNLAYRSKEDFVEDLDLIWYNCRKYDVNPGRFGIRASYALKETQKLVSLIPNIAIRDRVEVEAPKLQLQNEYFKTGEDEDSDDKPIISSRKLKAPADKNKHAAYLSEQ